MILPFLQQEKVFLVRLKWIFSNKTSLPCQKQPGVFTWGFSISGIVGYSSSMTLDATGLTSTAFPFSTSYSAGGVTATIPGSADYTFDIKTKAKWEYYTVGSEVRLWYNLFFFIPYVGLGVNYNSGSFITEMSVPAALMRLFNLKDKMCRMRHTDPLGSAGSCPANGARGKPVKRGDPAKYHTVQC